MNLYQKIVEVRKEAKGFHKDAKSFNYKYVTGNQILEKIRDKMNELNLLLIPSTQLGEHYTHKYITGAGTPKEKENIDFVVSGVMSYTWIDGDKPENTLTVDWTYYGQQDDISKAYGSALTYSERYFLLKCLGLPTDEDDPDAKGYTPQPVTQKPINKPQEKKPETKSDPKLLSQMFELIKLKDAAEKTVDYTNKQFKKKHSKELTEVEIKKTIEWLKGQ